VEAFYSLGGWMVCMNWMCCVFVVLFSVFCCSLLNVCLEHDSVKGMCSVEGHITDDLCTRSLCRSVV